MQVDSYNGGIYVCVWGGFFYSTILCLEVYWGTWEAFCLLDLTAAYRRLDTDKPKIKNVGQPRITHPSTSMHHFFSASSTESLIINIEECDQCPLMNFNLRILRWAKKKLRHGRNLQSWSPKEVQLGAGKHKKQMLMGPMKTGYCSH